MERLESGERRLDELLGGGLPKNGITLIVGHPGSGKTILAEQYMFHNATEDRRALYLSTVSEPFDKVLRFGESLSFFDANLIGGSVVYGDLGEALIHEGLPGVLGQIDHLMKTVRPAIVVIDSFKALRAFSKDDAEFRRFLHELAGRLTAVAVSALWVGEYDRDQAADAPEFAVADTTIALLSKRTAERELRVLQVLKMRGASFRSGEHAYRITKDGLAVFPRLADPQDDGGREIDGDRHSSGIAALDESLSGGWWPGAVTLLAGPTGIGKTLLALRFVLAGAEQGEPGIFTSFEESTTQLGRVAQGIGCRLDTPGVHVLVRSPVDLYVDEWIYELLDTVERTGARRVVIDSIDTLITASPDHVRFREMIYSLGRRLAHLGTSFVITHEIGDLFRVVRLSEIGMSFLADNVIVLQYVRQQAQLKRALFVLKSRGTAHGLDIREFEIGANGFTLGDPINPEPTIAY
jgi:circadian clock protein KaiC